MKFTRATRAALISAHAAALLFTLISLGSAAVFAGCGMIADKGRIRVARIDNEFLTRDDLDGIIRNMRDDERPIIRTRTDLLRVLENFIDSEVKRLAAEKLKEAGKIHVPREAGEALFNLRNPDMAIAMNVQDPRDLGMTTRDIEHIRELREALIDRYVDELLGEEAVRYHIAEAVQAQTLSITPEEYEYEFNLRQRDLVTPERITFHGLWYDQTNPDSPREAAMTRQRLEMGESFDAIVKEYPPERMIRATVENDPSNIKYRGFWQNASGAQPGQIVGPVVVLAPELTTRNAQGQVMTRQLPNIFLVCKILEREAPRPMALDEAKEIMAPDIYYRKMIKLLRDRYRVEVYESNLPDPSMYGGSDTIRGGPRQSLAPRQ